MSNLNASNNHPKKSSYQLVETIVNACRDAKGKDVAILDVSYAFDLAQYFIVVSGRSDRHVQGICNRVSLALKKANAEPLAVEGFDDGHWVLMDCSDVILHIFYEPVREHYDIEGLWLQAERVEVAEAGAAPSGLQAA